jgi:D-threo-aldose 1-dehydrogenase
MKEIAKIQLGQTDLYLPQIGLGTAHLDSAVPEAQAVETIQYALERGVNYFDTAPLYGRALVEKRLGLALAGVPRHQYLLSTKVGRLIQPSGRVVWDFSRAGVLRSIEQSLERLQCSTLDLLLIHDPDEHYQQALGEAFPTLADLRRQGVVRAIGVGMNQWQMLADFARDADMDCFLLAGRYTLLDQSASRFMDLCREKKIGLLIGGVFNSGILATGAIKGARYNYRKAPQKVREKTRQLTAVCQRFHVPLIAAALHFPLAHPATSSLLIGCTSPQMVQDSLDLLEMEIPAALWATFKNNFIADWFNLGD